MNIKQSTMYSTEQARELLGLTGWQMRKLINKKWLTPVRQGRRKFIGGSQLIYVRNLIETKGMSHLLPGRDDIFESSPAGFVRAVFGP